MTASKNKLNSFYQGLNLLIQYETSSSDNSPTEIKGIVKLLNDALKKGDVIAPFFLDYIADKYPNAINKKSLPNLSSVPSHKSQAKMWVDSYKEFLSINKDVARAYNPTIYTVKSERAKKSLEKLYKKNNKKLKKGVNKLLNYDSSLTHLLTAKILQAVEKFQKNAENQKKVSSYQKSILEAYEQSAFYPNVLGMTELIDYLIKNGLFLNYDDDKKKKIGNELKILLQHEGNISYLAEHYMEINEARYYSQWLFQAAIHGDLFKAFELMWLYAEDQTKWYNQLDKKQTLSEAILWCDWIFEYAKEKDLEKLIEKVSVYTDYFEEFIGKNRDKGTLLVYLILKVNDTILDQRLKSTENLLISSFFQNMISKLPDLVHYVWKTHGKSLPEYLINCSTVNVYNELARKFDSLDEYHLAEQFYRQALENASDDNQVELFNLANSLGNQDKQLKEQVQLYSRAAKKSCIDSLMRLFQIFVIDAESSTDDLENLERLLKRADSSSLPTEKGLLLNLIQLTKIQSLQNLDKPFLVWEKFNTDSGIIYEFKLNIIQADCDSNPLDAIVQKSQQPEKITHDSTSKELIEANSDVGTIQAKQNQSSPYFFKPKTEKTTKSKLPAKQERALNKLSSLNEKLRKNLTQKDLIEAQKAYSQLIGNSGTLKISHKGRTSGSRAQVAGKNLHISHGRDRLKPGAQHDIQKTIEHYCEELSEHSSFQNHL